MSLTLTSPFIRIPATPGSPLARQVRNTQAQHPNATPEPRTPERPNARSLEHPDTRTPGHSNTRTPEHPPPSHHPCAPLCSRCMSALCPLCVHGMPAAFPLYVRCVSALCPPYARCVSPLPCTLSGPSMPALCPLCVRSVSALCPLAVSSMSALCRQRSGCSTGGRASPQTSSRSAACCTTAYPAGPTLSAARAPAQAPTPTTLSREGSAST